MAKWVLRTGALGIVTAMLVLARRGHPLATLPHAGDALALDFLQVLAVLVALLALLISSTVRTLNRSANIALDAETVAHEYNELIASARDVMREIEKKRPATFSDLTAQVDTIDRLVDSEDASRFERRPWSPLRWEGTIYVGAVLLFFIHVDRLRGGELLTRRDSPPCQVDMSPALSSSYLGSSSPFWELKVSYKLPEAVIDITACRKYSCDQTRVVNLKRHRRG